METVLKSNTLDGLKLLIVECDHYKQWQEKQASLVMRIKTLVESGEYVERDLTEELISIRQALYINMVGSHIIDGYNDNRPYLRSMGGNSRMKDIEFRDSSNNFIRKEYIYEIPY